MDFNWDITRWGARCFVYAVSEPKSFNTTTYRLAPLLGGGLAWSLTVQGENFGPIQQEGYHSSIAVREDGVWKKRLVTWNVTPAPAAKPSPTTSPSSQ
jgi:hypothetical protein